MLANQRVRVLKEKIVNHHGRIEDIRLFDSEPSQDQLSMGKMQMEAQKLKQAQAAADANNLEEEKEPAGGKKKKEQVQASDFTAEEFDDDTAYLYHIFRDRKLEQENAEKKANHKVEPGQPRLQLPDPFYYGYPDKTEADEHPVKVFYDFHPYNNKDPVLLTLMVTDPKSKEKVWAKTTEEKERVHWANCVCMVHKLTQREWSL